VLRPSVLGGGRRGKLKDQVELPAVLLRALTEVPDLKRRKLDGQRAVYDHRTALQGCFFGLACKGCNTTLYPPSKLAMSGYKQAFSTLARRRQVRCCPPPRPSVRVGRKSVSGFETNGSASQPYPARHLQHLN